MYSIFWCAALVQCVLKFKVKGIENKNVLDKKNVRISDKLLKSLITALIRHPYDLVGLLSLPVHSLI